MLSEFPPGAEAVALAHRLTPSVYSRDGLARLAAAARGAQAVHVKVDTGMHRVGVWPPEDLPAFLGEVADGRPRDRGDLDAPRQERGRSRDDLDAAGPRTARRSTRPRPPGSSLACGTRRTAAACCGTPKSHFDLVRPGIALYGVGPDEGVGADRGLRPALTWRSTVAFARPLAEGERVSYGLRYALDRDAVVATVPVGYADGYPARPPRAPTS